MRVILALVLTAGLSGGAAWGAWSNEQLVQPDSTEASELFAATPVLSMRRVPEVLLRPRRDAAVAAAVASIPDRIPGESCLVVTEAGRPLFDHAGTRPLVPASTQKLLVGAALFDMMSPDAVFATELMSLHAIDGGVIAGDVWLVGGGDPLLTTEAFRARSADIQREFTRFEDLADELVAAGLRRIDGSIIGDGTRYDQVYDIPSWPARYRDQVSAGPLAGLTVNEGLTTFTPGRVSQNPGTPSTNPPAHAATVLTDLLRERGVEVGGSPGSGQVPDGASRVAQLPSLPLQVVVTQMNQWSDNTVAELLLKELGHRGMEQGSSVAGGSVLVSTLASMGVDVDGVAPVDGSGLALDNQATCRALVEVLDLAGPDSQLADTLAVAGQSGTLRNRLLDTPAAGRLQAKTGSLRHVATLAGYVHAESGYSYTFAIIANLPDGAFMPSAAFDLQDELAITLATLPEIRVSPELEPLEPARR